jgi:uncharacterized membrane protein YphA (DoxX/SURF4 family)
LDAALWVLQVMLALAFLGAGYDQAANYDDAARRLRWVASLPQWLAASLGLLEILAALALVIPPAIGYGPWLAPAAALALALLMAGAVVFHSARTEIPQLAFSGTLGLVAVVVALGRFVVAPF